MASVATSRSFYFSSLAFLVINTALTVTGSFYERPWTPQVWLVLLWGLVAVLTMEYYLDNALLKVSENHIPYLWVAVWPLAFPGEYLEKISIKVLVAGTAVLILFVLITRSYGKSPSQTVFFMWGLLAGLPVWRGVSPFIFLPIAIITVAIIHPVHLAQIAALLLGFVSFLLWAWFLKDYISFVSEDLYGLFMKWPGSWDYSLLLTLWMVLWIGSLLAGNFWLLSRLQSLKVWHRRIINASWVSLAMFPWSLLWGFELPGAVWLSLPFSVLSLVAFFNWAPYRVGIWLFMLVNAALLIINFASW